MVATSSLDETDPMHTLRDPNFTYHWDKVSCIKDAYFAHVVFSYLIFLAGLGCFITRLLPGQFKWMHVWFGRIYIMSMLWCAGTSLVIHNSGLPPAVLVSFVWVLGGLCLGWVVINFYQYNMQKQATVNVQEIIKTVGVRGDLGQMIQEEKGKISNNRKFVQRFLSLKTLHGCLMFWSWINITGRIFASNQTGDFTCHTYPVYKFIDTPHGNYSSATSPVYLPIRDPKFERLPWARSLTGWGVALSIGPLLGSAAVGLVWSFFASRNAPGPEPAAPQAVGNSHLEAGSSKVAMQVSMGNGQSMRPLPPGPQFPFSGGEMTPLAVTHGANYPR